jgi:arylsulfatase A-like enzyme
MLEFSGAQFPKQYPHDYSLRVPYIMSWPGKIKADQTTDLLFGAMDIMPTVLGLMDQKVPVECQGKNLASSILNGDEDAVDYVPIWSFYRNSYKGVITRDWTYSTLQGDTDAPLHQVLFDRKNDPYQLNNLFDSPQHKAVKEELWEKTAAWMEKFEDPFYTGEDLWQVMPKEEWDLNRTQLPIQILQTHLNK